MPIGKLRHKIGFYPRVACADDTYGDRPPAYSDKAAFTARCEIVPKFGGEQILAQRLAGVTHYTINMRWFAAFERVTTDWRAKNEHSGELMNIRSITNPDGRKQWAELLCDTGVAA